MPPPDTNCISSVEKDGQRFLWAQDKRAETVTACNNVTQLESLKDRHLKKSENLYLVVNAFYIFYVLSMSGKYIL